MTHIHNWSAMGLALMLACTTAASSEELTIAENGSTRAVVCIASDDARKTAEELAHYIEQMSGARPVIADEPEAVAAALASDAPVFILGELALNTLPELRKALQSAVPATRVRRDGDAIALRREGNRIYLAGVNERSHSFAVTRLLNLWGCYWYMPTEFGECIPDRPKLTIDELNEIHASPFLIRRYWLAWRGSNQGLGDFQRRNFMGGRSIPNKHALGNYVKELIPEGKSRLTLHIAEPATAQHIAAQLHEKFAAGEDFPLSMNDGVYVSDSKLDAELQANFYDKYMLAPMLTDAFMTMYNNIAKILLEQHPDSPSAIGFLAYGNITMPPQRKFHAASPLVAVLAPIDIDPNHGMDDPRSPPRQEYREMLYRWSEIMDGRVTIYDYDQGMLVWRDLPNPSHQAFRHDIKHYRAAGILGIDTESRGAIATTFLNFHLRGQLMWDPDFDVDAHLAAFYPAFYGPASTAMASYWGAIFKAWEDTIITEHEWYTIPAIYTDALVETLRGHLIEAQRAIEPLRAREPDQLTRNERLYVERMVFTEHSFNVIDHYTTMLRFGAREGDYVTAAQSGRKALEAREALRKMNPTFITWEPPRGTAWFPGEVKHYTDLAARTDGTTGTLIARLPLEWAFRRDPNDTGLPMGFGRQQPDLTYWQANKDRYATPEARKDYPTTEWEMLRTDLYAQAQGVLHPDWQSFTGFMWYKTDVTINADQLKDTVHVHFPGLFSEAWLYVNGYLVAHRPQNHMWWKNNYLFDWDINLSSHLQEGKNDITLRIHNTHHNGGLFRRPFLYRPMK